MNNIAYLRVNEKYLRKILGEAGSDFWGDLKLETQRALKRILETSMEIEVQDLTMGILQTK